MRTVLINFNYFRFYKTVMQIQSDLVAYSAKSKYKARDDVGSCHMIPMSPAVDLYALERRG